VPAAGPVVGTRANDRQRRGGELVWGVTTAHETQAHRHLAPLIGVVVVPVLGVRQKCAGGPRATLILTFFAFMVRLGWGELGR